MCVLNLLCLVTTFPSFDLFGPDIKFDENGGYSPVIHINDYWNLAQDYQPLNDTTKYFCLKWGVSPLTPSIPH